MLSLLRSDDNLFRRDPYLCGQVPEITKFALAEFDAAKRWILGNDAR